MIKERIAIDDYFLSIAQVVSLRATCARRRVGCVLVNHMGHIIGTGYNGVAAGAPHCLDHHCPGAEALSGTSLGLCEAIHAEQNALLQCRDVQQIRTAYCTASPCTHCVKLLANTSCQSIVFLEDYPHSTSSDYWKGLGRLWQKYDPVISAERPTASYTIRQCFQNYGKA